MNAIDRWLVLFVIAAVLFTGCTREDTPVASRPSVPEKPAAPARPSTVAPIPGLVPRVAFADSLKLQRVELASEALAIWRQYASQRPTLLLLSDEPMLMPVPAAVAAEAGAFAETAPPAELARRSHPATADVLLLPDMTVDLALRRNWVGKFAWALPLRDPDRGLTLEPFRKRLQEQGLATAEEAATLHGDSERLEGTLRGVPVEMAALDRLLPVAGPVIVHIDMSYFKNLYKNDVATPLLQMVVETMAKLRKRKLPVLAVTFSYGNLDGRIALDARFAGDAVADLFARPQMFDQPVPVDWERQDQILYLVNFMQKEKVRDLALAQEQDLPKAAWVKYNLYQAAAALHEGNRAMIYLEEAVRRDRVYALEYLYLAQMAFEKKVPGDTLRMLRLAQAAFPDNPDIRLQIALLTAELGDRKTALHLVEQLQALSWSPVYQARMPDYLRSFADYLRQPPVALPGEAAQVPLRRPALPAGVVRPPGHP